MQTIKEIFDCHYKEANILIIENITSPVDIAKTLVANDNLTFETRKLAIKRENRLTSEIERLQAEILKLKAEQC